MYAVRNEMAQKLADVVLRRTELGMLGHPGPDALRACAEIVAHELGWDSTTVDRELAETEALLARAWARPVRDESRLVRSGASYEHKTGSTRIRVG